MSAHTALRFAHWCVERAKIWEAEDLVFLASVAQLDLDTPIPDTSPILRRRDGEIRDEMARVGLIKS